MCENVHLCVGLLLVLGLCAGQEHEGLDWLIESVPGVPGEDYPIYAEVPDTGFSCDGQVEGGEVVYFVCLLESEELFTINISSF